MVSHTIVITLFFLVFYDIISMTSCPCSNSLTSASCASPFFTLHGYGNAVVNNTPTQHGTLTLSVCVCVCVTMAGLGSGPC